jgi:hypothetical protein
LQAEAEPIELVKRLGYALRVVRQTAVLALVGVLLAGLVGMASRYASTASMPGRRAALCDPGEAVHVGSGLWPGVSASSS